MKTKVKFDNISKKYSLYNKQSDKLFDLFFSKNKREGRSFFALKNVSFEVKEGETIGVVGINGAGKSTLSNLLAQIVPPTYGELEINGETSLIAISVGLNNNLSGLDNIELKCLMHGLDKDSIERLTPEIIEFADIGQFINQPVKNYSSGMKSRLGFAISAFIEPDILIVDEALSVGDQTFYEKCVKKINEFKQNGKTIFFISHSISQIKTISDKVLWLHYGEVKSFGETNQVLDEYSKFISWFNRLTNEEKKQYKKEMANNQAYIDVDIKSRSVLNTATNKYIKSKHIFITLQISLLLLGTLISGLFMFVDKPTAIFNKDTINGAENIVNINTKENNEVLSELQEGNIININKVALLSVEESNIYFDSDLKYKLAALPFSREIYVEEEINNVYKVKLDDMTGFMKMDGIKFVEELNNETMVLVDLIPLFPNNVQSSYEYFLAQLGTSTDELENKLLGITGKTLDEEAKINIHLANEGITYIFNADGLAKSIIIRDVELDEETISNLVSNALITNNEDLFYVKTNDYDVIINLKNNTMQLNIQ